MLILVYGIPDSVPIEKQKALREKILDKVREILCKTNKIIPVFTEIIPSRSSNSAGIFAQMHIDKEETDIQTKKELIEKSICYIFHEFAIPEVTTTWMVGAFSTVDNFHFAEIEL